MPIQYSIFATGPLVRLFPAVRLLIFHKMSSGTFIPEGRLLGNGEYPISIHSKFWRPSLTKSSYNWALKIRLMLYLNLELKMRAL